MLDSHTLLVIYSNIRKEDQMKILKCKRCNHEWASRKPDKVKVCPKCKSPYWDTDKIKRKQVENDG